jgi:hypothetical protein
MTTMDNKTGTTSGDGDELDERQGNGYKQCLGPRYISNYSFLYVTNGTFFFIVFR